VTPALKKTGQSILISVVAPPIIDRSEPICSGKNFPNPQKIPAPGLHRATHQIVFTRPRELLGCVMAYSLMVCLYRRSFAAGFFQFRPGCEEVPLSLPPNVHGGTSQSANQRLVRKQSAIWLECVSYEMQPHDKSRAIA
jgi:hypothetical protein